MDLMKVILDWLQCGNVLYVLKSGIITDMNITTIFSMLLKVEQTSSLVTGLLNGTWRLFMRRIILFLDIDGVLNSELFYRHRRVDVGSDIDPDAIALLNGLCSDVGAYVVVSSTWRLGHDVDSLQEFFDSHGGTFKVVGLTPYLSYCRGVEIEEWLKENVTDGSDTDRYVIIDDDADMLLSQKDHFFQTDPYCGLSPTVCYRIKDFVSRLV